jgi:uncharacterized protein YabE (DUF348 family)
MSEHKDAPPAHEGPGEEHHGHHHEVEISINGKHFKVHEVPTSVKQLKHLAGIPHEDVLGQEVGGKFHPFAQDGEVHIHGGEVFLSRSHEITIWIDKQKFELTTHELTVAQLLELAKDDPKQTTLELKKGNELEKFLDLNQIICLKYGMRFVVIHNEPTPVS